MNSIFSIFDSKANYFLNPFVMQYGAALRSFIHVANDASHDIGKHPEDYVLYQLGEFNPSDGSITLLSTPKSIASGLQMRSAPVVSGTP